MVVLTCFVMCGLVYAGCFDNCLGVLVIRVLVFTCFVLSCLCKFIVNDFVCMVLELLPPSDNTVVCSK